MNLSPEFWLQVAIYLIGGASAVVAVAFRIGQIEARFATKQDLLDKVRERNDKIDRVYARFDEFKKIANTDYVRRDMCAQVHTTSTAEMKRIDEEYKQYRHEMRNQVQQIFDKIDQLKELIQKK